MDDRIMVKKIAGRTKLTGLTKDGSPANTRQSRDVVCFVTPNGKYKLQIIRPADVDMLLLDGPGITEFFVRDKRRDYFKGWIKGEEVNIEIKKISGEIRFITYVPGPYSLGMKLQQKYEDNYYDR